MTRMRRLASALERQGHWLDRHKDSFRLSAIPSAVERAFSKRRQAIEHARPDAWIQYQFGHALRTLEQPSRMAGLRPRLRDKDREYAWQR
jgi:hypothetical protein